MLHFQRSEVNFRDCVNKIPIISLKNVKWLLQYYQSINEYRNQCQRDQSGTRLTGLVPDTSYQIPGVYGYNVTPDWYQISHIKYQVFMDNVTPDWNQISHIRYSTCLWIQYRTRLVPDTSYQIPGVCGYNVTPDWYQIFHIRYQVLMDTMSHQTGTISDIPRVYGYNIALDWYHISYMYQIFHVFMDTISH